MQFPYSKAGGLDASDLSTQKYQHKLKHNFRVLQSDQCNPIEVKSQTSPVASAGLAPICHCLSGCKAQSWTKTYSRGLTRDEVRGWSPSLHLLAPLLLVQTGCAQLSLAQGCADDQFLACCHSSLNHHVPFCLLFRRGAADLAAAVISCRWQSINLLLLFK